MLARLDQRGARYPAEHNVGHHYSADRPLAGFYKSLDPGNRFNAGIELMSKHYRTEPADDFKKDPYPKRDNATR
jgi:D-lactate dehydrogenase